MGAVRKTIQTVEWFATSIVIDLPCQLSQVLSEVIKNIANANEPTVSDDNLTYEHAIHSAIQLSIRSQTCSAVLLRK